MSNTTDRLTLPGGLLPHALQLVEGAVWAELESAFGGDPEIIDLRSLGRLRDAYALALVVRGALYRGESAAVLDEREADTLRWVLRERQDDLRDTMDDPAETPEDKDEARRELYDLGALEAALGGGRS